MIRPLLVSMTSTFCGSGVRQSASVGGAARAIGVGVGFAGFGAATAPADTTTAAIAARIGVDGCCALMAIA